MEDFRTIQADDMASVHGGVDRVHATQTAETWGAVGSGLGASVIGAIGAHQAGGGGLVGGALGGALVGYVPGYLAGYAKGVIETWNQ
jgi:hypothetical protein